MSRTARLQPAQCAYKPISNDFCLGLWRKSVNLQAITRSLYARANMIIRKFSSASLNTKLMLFRAYCTPMYGCQLWCSMYQYSFNKLRVAYNDAFRQLLQEPRWCSASKLFVFNSVLSLPENMRKLTFSLWRSLQISDNSLVNAVLSSDLFF